MIIITKLKKSSSFKHEHIKHSCGLQIFKKMQSLMPTYKNVNGKISDSMKTGSNILQYW